jgi:hypothetical protein
MAHYRIVEIEPNVFHITKKKFWRGWELLAVGLSMNDADQKLNEIRAGVRLAFPRVVREVFD